MKSVREINITEDYQEICAWWDDWGWPNIPKKILPPTGYMIVEEGVRICAAWLYLTNSGLSSIEWIIMNKETTKEQRQGAIEMLFEYIEKEAEKYGANTVITNLINPNLKYKLNKVGYIEGDGKLYSMIKQLS